VGRASSRLTERAATLPIRADGSARIAVVADTHSRPHPDTATHLARLSPDAILHAGDIGDLAVLDSLAAVAPLFVIRGNIDVRAADLPDVLTLDVVGPGQALRILLIHIAVNGPRLHPEVARRARAEGASMVVCGHSHVPFIGLDRGLTVFNPGSVGPRRFQLPIVFGTIDVTPAGVRLAHVDCETGQPWLPPAY
jgi:putative phosphoesterase